MFVPIDVPRDQLLLVSVVSGFSRTASAIAASLERRDGVSLREPFRQPGKTALRFDPDRWSRRLFDHPIYQRSVFGLADRRCDLRSDRREAPRSAPFYLNQTGISNGSLRRRRPSDARIEDDARMRPMTSDSTVD
jgi:hypothetical protein